MQRRTVLKGAGAAIVAGQLGLAGANAAGATLAQDVLWVAAHPDDETLGYSLEYLKHRAAGLRCHVLWLTHGENTGARGIINGTGTDAFWNGRVHNPSAEGYAPLTKADIARARVTETETAVRALGAGLPGSLTMWHANPLLPDGYGGTGTAPTTLAVAQAQAAILAVCRSITSGPVRLKGHSWLDTAPDHAAAGAAIRNLAAKYPTLYGDRTHFLRPQFWARPPAGAAYAWSLPTSADQVHRVRNAITAFGAWAPTLGAYGVGQISVPGDFATLEATPKSLLHH